MPGTRSSTTICSPSPMRAGRVTGEGEVARRAVRRGLLLDDDRAALGVGEDAGDGLAGIEVDRGRDRSGRSTRRWSGPSRPGPSRRRCTCRGMSAGVVWLAVAQVEGSPSRRQLAAPGEGEGLRVAVGQGLLLDDDLGQLAVDEGAGHGLAGRQADGGATWFGWPRSLTQAWLASCQPASAARRRCSCPDRGSRSRSGPRPAG